MLEEKKQTLGKEVAFYSTRKKMKVEEKREGRSGKERREYESDKTRREEIRQETIEVFANLNEGEDEDMPYGAKGDDEDDGGGYEGQEVFPSSSHCIHLPVV